MPLDRAAAEAAVRRHVGEPLGLSLEEAAWGIHAIVTENMANAALMHAVERGKEIDGYDLYAFGGAAPMHVGTLAERLGIRTVVVPPGAGVRSCFGFLASPLAFEVARSRTVRLETADLDDVAALLEALEADARAPLALAGVAAGDVTVRRFAEMRYRGQGYEIEVPLPPGRPDAAWLAALVAAFEERVPDLLSPRAVGAADGGGDVAGARSVAARRRCRRRGRPRRPGRRRRASGRVWIPAEQGVPLGARLGPLRACRRAGARPGPAVIEEVESTTVVTPGVRRRRRRRAQPGAHAEAGMKRRASDPVFVEVAWSRLISRGRAGGPGAAAHGLHQHRARVGRPLGRRLRPAGPDGRPGHHRHAGPHQLDGAGGAPRAARGAAGDARRPATCSPPTIPGSTPATSTTSRW